MVIDGQYDGPGVTLKMLFRRRTFYQRKCQKERLTTLDRVEVLYDRFGETFRCRATEAAPPMVGQYRNKTMSNGIQVAISREHKREVLGQKVAKGDVSRSIRIYI